MRLGIVPYLNAFPLVYGLECEKFVAPPAKLAQMAASEDIVLAPIVAAFQDDSWHLIDGIGIGSFGPVETVKLVFKNTSTTIENVRSIYMDEESQTSKALLKIILRNFYHRSLDSILFLNQVEDADGALLIGDKVWSLKGTWNMEHRTWNSDLGEIWTTWTHLPFVYACWMTRSRETGEKWKKVLLNQAQKNLENLPPLVPKVPKNNCPDLLAYWKRLRSIIDEEGKKGVELFQKMWCELENKPCLPLKWL